MATHRRPSPELSAYLEAHQYSFSKAVRKGGFDYLLHRWEQIVSSIETGYRGILDEYLNDMDLRKAIDRLATYASDDEWAEVEASLPTLDDRFHAATRRVDVCIWGEHNAAKHDYRADRDWWYYRLPLNLDSVAGRSRWP